MWKVEAASLRTEPGFVVNPANGKKLSYGEIAAKGELPEKLPVIKPEELKARKDWRLITKGVPRRDIPGKVNGTAQYGIDVQVPGMVYASAVHRQSGAALSWNDAEIAKMPGVLKTLKVANGVAVVAKTYPQAMAARDETLAVRLMAEHLQNVEDSLMFERTVPSNDVAQALR
jgi:isoquinoline 1-oxidoreductase beta subunit